MSDGQWLLLIFTLIYVSDSVAWFGPRSYLLYSFLGNRLLVRRHRFYFPGVQSGCSFLNPFPFLGQGYVATLFPFSVTGKGLSPFGVENPNPGSEALPEAGARACLWEDLKLVQSDQKKLLINGKPFMKFSSMSCAAYWRDHLRRLKEMNSAQEREEAVQAILRSYLNENRARRRLKILRRATLSLRLHGNMLLFVTFLFLPWVYWQHGDSLELLWGCLLLWVLMVVLSFESFCLHRRFCPESRMERYQHLFLSLFLPNHAIRSIDFVSKHFFRDCHPLTLAAVSAKEDELDKLKRALARDIEFPIPGGRSGLEATLQDEFREKYYLPLLKERLTDWESLIGPPSDLESPAYCPRCLTSYESTDWTCEDCGGIKVCESTKENKETQQGTVGDLTG